MAELEPGAIFAGHRIEGIAGRGGFGVVYRATHLVLDHVVALKLISSGRAGEENFRERFKSESRIAVSIRHPNVVAVHNAGEENGLLFVTMDFIEGTDLRGLLNREGRLKPDNAVTIVRQLAAALDAAHAKGLVHRDIKPGNVLIDERDGGQHVYLTDFGLSKQMDATSGVTASGAFVGTLDYVAPEQIRGDRLDARTDVYALGCVMFELLAGDVPFAGQEEKVAKIYAHLQEQPPELIDAAPEVPAALSEVVWRSMSKDPDARHPSAGDFARAATAAVEGRQPSEPERNVGIGAAAPTQVHDVLAGAVAGGALDETAEAAGPETAEVPPPEAPDAAGAETVNVPPPARAGAAGSGTVEVPPPEAAEVPEASLPGETVTVPPPPGRPPEPSTQPDAPAPTKGGRGRLVAGLLIAAALAGGAYLAFGQSDEPSQGGGNAAGDGAGGGGGLSGIEVAPKPVGVAVGDGIVWVSSRDGQTLTRLDAATGDELGTNGLGGLGEQVTLDQTGDAWVAVGTGAGSDGYVRRYSPDGEQIAEITVGSEPRGIAIGKEFAWVANNASDTVTQIAVATNEVAGAPVVGSEPARAAQGNPRDQGNEDAEGIWVTNAGSDSVSRITDQGATVTTVEGVSGTPRGIAVSLDGVVWVAAQDGDSLHRIEPEPDPAASGIAGSVAETIDISENCEEPRTLAVGLGSVWATCGTSDNLARFDEATGKFQGEVGDIGPDPEGVAVDDDGVWVTSGGQETAKDPGTVTLVDPDDVG
jgi:streptogramin lyase